MHYIRAINQDVIELNPSCTSPSLPPSPPPSLPLYPSPAEWEAADQRRAGGQRWPVFLCRRLHWGRGHQVRISGTKHHRLYLLVLEWSLFCWWWFPFFILFLFPLLNPPQPLCHPHPHTHFSYHLFTPSYFLPPSHPPDPRQAGGGEPGGPGGSRGARGERPLGDTRGHRCQHLSDEALSGHPACWWFPPRHQGCTCWRHYHDQWVWNSVCDQIKYISKLDSNPVWPFCV